MRLLLIHVTYPPHYVGGYDLGCGDVVEGLRARGHEVRVLTSMYGVWQPQYADGVYRWLLAYFDRPPFDVRKLVRKEYCNRRAMRRVFAEFRPDLVYVFNPALTSHSIVAIAQGAGIPTAFLVSDWWVQKVEVADEWRAYLNPTFVRSRTRLRRLGRTALIRALRWLDRAALAPLQFRNVHFVSERLRGETLRSGKGVANSTVLYWGINVDRFPFQKISQDPRRVLYVGRISPDKGVDTLIAAMKILADRRDMKLTVAGGGLEVDYIAQAHRAVQAAGLDNAVEFRGWVPREEVAQLYREHGLLVFPSRYEEPFAIALLEAMASGIPIVASATGGTPEAIQHGENGLLFEGGNAEACAAQMARMIDDGELRERLRRNARRTVEERFTLDRMLDEIEVALQRAVSDAKNQAASMVSVGEAA